MEKKFELKSKPSIIGFGNCVGKLESDGPLKEYFDLTDEDSKFCMKTWEKAESEMIRRAVNVTFKKTGLTPEKIDLAFGGDLSNQCTATALGMRDSKIPYVGLYGACSTFALGIGLAALAIESGNFYRTLVISSSHYSSAERQYRFPLEYGCQRTPTAQTTVTGAGCVILEKNTEDLPYVSEFLAGKICDLGISDANNMGAAMAPAAADTVLRYFQATGEDPNRFDYILTGDLGFEGHRIFTEICLSEGLDLGKNNCDCGKMIYDPKYQDVNAGGSGCGCSASVFTSIVMNRFFKNEINDVLLIGTGALLNPSTVLQNETIPGIAHLIRIRSRK